MKIVKNYIIESKHNRPILLDYGYKKTQQPKPIVVFLHGFKGFKDWGHFNKIMEHFINEEFGFVKFNFSHNGGTVNQPIDFPDLEAFGNNNYSKELDDLTTVIDWIEQTDELLSTEIDNQKIYLMGHSRGGGIAILGANSDKRIKKLVTWSAVSDFYQRLPHDMTKWKNDGVIYIENGRTKQQMPMYYQFVEDLMTNKEKLSIPKAAKEITIPFKVFHGTNDEVLSVDEAKQLVKWNKKASLKLIEGAGHTCSAKHPFEELAFPKHAKELIDNTIAFFELP